MTVSSGRKHHLCGLTGPGYSGCLRCGMVSEYLSAREDYLNRCEDLDPPYFPQPRVDFHWWLQHYSYP